MDCSTPGFPVHHQLPEPVKTHIHPVSDAIQPSHPLPSPSPPALNLSQHRGLSSGPGASSYARQLNGIPMTVLRLTRKDQKKKKKKDGGVLTQFLGIPTPSPKQLE